MSQEDAIQQYKEYNFNKDKCWREYLQNLIPTPSNNEMERLKRVWYKENIDEELDINFLDEKYTPKQTLYERYRILYNKIKLLLKLTFYHIENMGKIVFLTSIFFFRPIAHYLSILICFLALIRQLKRPGFSKDCVRQILNNEFTHNLFYILIFTIFSSIRSIIHYLPLMIHFWIGICDYLNIQQGKMYERSKQLVDKSLQNKEVLKLQKAKVEIYIFGFTLVSIFIWRSLFQQYIFNLVFYFNFLRVKYMLNENTKKAFSTINDSLGKSLGAEDSHFLSKKCLSLIRRLFNWFITYDKTSKEKEDK